MVLGQANCCIKPVFHSQYIQSIILSLEKQIIILPHVHAKCNEGVSVSG